MDSPDHGGAQDVAVKSKCGDERQSRQATSYHESFQHQRQGHQGLSSGQTWKPKTDSTRRQANDQQAQGQRMERFRPTRASASRRR